MESFLLILLSIRVKLWQKFFLILLVFHLLLMLTKRWSIVHIPQHLLLLPCVLNIIIFLLFKIPLSVGALLHQGTCDPLLVLHDHVVGQSTLQFVLGETWQASDSWLHLGNGESVSCPFHLLDIRQVFLVIDRGLIEVHGVSRAHQSIHLGHIVREVHRIFLLVMGLRK